MENPHHQGTAQHWMRYVVMVLQGRRRILFHDLSEVSSDLVLASVALHTVYIQLLYIYICHKKLPQITCNSGW